MDLIRAKYKDKQKEMAYKISLSVPTFHFLSLQILSLFYYGAYALELNYYAKTCPRAEEIVKEEVTKLYYEHGNTAVSWLRTLFHDCAVKSCDASILLDNVKGIESEKNSQRNFGMRNFKYINTIKSALEKECPRNVSCADVIALSARDGIALLGGPRVEMKTGRMDSKVSYAGAVEQYIPNHNDTISLYLSRFESLGLDVEATVALLGGHSVGRVHCINLVQRLYPTVDPTLDPDYAVYLKGRCPSPNPDPKAVEYARNDRITTMKLDNNYYKNVLNHKGLLSTDEHLGTDPRTSPYVIKMAADNNYFHEQFARAILILSENNPLSADEGEIRKDCRFVNSYIK